MKLKVFLFFSGHTVIELVREFLEFFNLEFSQAVFEPESGAVSFLLLLCMRQISPRPAYNRVW